MLSDWALILRRPNKESGVRSESANDSGRSNLARTRARTSRGLQARASFCGCSFVGFSEKIVSIMNQYPKGTISSE